jgi:hypothetical protein
MADDKTSQLGAHFWAKNLDSLDREIARLALLCNVRLLDPGVIERVLKNDASVCGTKNDIGFRKMRDILLMHYKLREQAVSSLGEAQTMALVQSIVQNLRATFGDKLGQPAQ